MPSLPACPRLQSICLCSVAVCLLIAGPTAARKRTFEIDNDRFLADGKTVQLISGSVHYQRIHPDLWEDRLQRVRALGLNAIETYVPWNTHEPHPGQFSWTGFADLERFLKLAHDYSFYVLLRPGPYICAEWDFGGFPWWLASKQVAGGGTMKLRSADPDFLALVDRWWAQLLPRIAPFLYQRGGPIVMVQVENEYGFVGPDEEYIRHLVASARHILGDEVVLYTTDPPTQVAKGSLEGEEVFSVIDFGAGWFDLEWAFAQQRAMNPPGKSPVLCSEYYSGWLSRWGEPMANTTEEPFLQTFRNVLAMNNGTGSINFYMVHGGTNFGFSAGGSIDNDTYFACITSYDYDAPISEAGASGQPGIGGFNKYEAIREIVAEHTGQQLPAVPPPPRLRAYGSVALTERAVLLSHLAELYPGDGIRDEFPRIMEEYGQAGGLILYRTEVPSALLHAGCVLDVGYRVHDYATVLVDGRVVARLDRNAGPRAHLGLVIVPGATATLDILVEAVGRSNQGWRFDTKGLMSPNVTLGGVRLKGWRVFPLPLDNLQAVHFKKENAPARQLEVAEVGPTMYRGKFAVDGALRGRNGLLPDSYLDISQWSKGVAFVNGFNLGWFWPAKGPTNTMYVPGPVLCDGENEVILLEVVEAPEQPKVAFSDEADFYGPGGRQAPSLQNRPPWNPTYGSKLHALGKSATLRAVVAPTQALQQQAFQ